MTVQIIGRQLDIGDALRGQIEDRMQSAINKYFDGGFNGHVTLNKQGQTFRSECVINLDSGVMLQAVGSAGDGYSSFAEAAEHLEKRLRRYKRRLKDHKSNKESRKNGIAAMDYVIEAPNQEAEIDEQEFSPVIIAESDTSLPSLAVSEAVLEMDMSGAPVFTFINDANGRLNIVYRRQDGHIGWIDPKNNS